MRLLTSAIPQVRRLLPTGHGLATASFAALLCGLELAGRAAVSDLHDGLAAMVLAAAVALLAARHRRDPFPWLAWLGGRVGRLAGRLDVFRYDHGMDLRGSPRLPRRLPPVAWALLAVVAAWAGLAGLAWAAYPTGWRAAGLRTSYVAYLVVLLAVWSGLLACTFAGVYVPVILFERWLRGLVREADRRGLGLALVAGYLMTVVAVAWLVPTAVVLALCLGVAAAAAVAVVRPGRDEPAVLWRTGPDRPTYSLPLHRAVGVGVGLGALAVFALLLTACGGRLLTPPEPTDPMMVTTMLGTLAAWFFPGVVAAAALRLWAGRRTDPARRPPPAVHLRADGVPNEELARATAAVRGWGWWARDGGKPRPGDVAVRVVPGEQSEATEFDPRWPLKISLDDLLSQRVRERLERRDEIQVRRQLFRGLATLFKRAAAERGPRGGGYWFAPHWWFITGLDREDPHRGRVDHPTPPRPVGPPFHRVFGPRVRQSFHRVLRATEIDMIFVEDGVSYRTFAKVVRAVFELYDVHDGRRKAEDHLFRGVPKVRVMVHEYAPGKAFKATGYREPKFDDLSRARVLHVFRDGGGQESPADTPFDFSWEPSPAMGAG